MCLVRGSFFRLASWSRPKSISPTSLVHTPFRKHSTSSLMTTDRTHDGVHSSAGTAQQYGNFDLVKSIKLDYTNVSISKWRSRKSGLTLLHLDYEAPIVKGYFVVASEIFDDTGRPHTLEHLVFMGSQKYPYKGVLDQLANRAFSEGTNAWTDQDHTAYTLATAGSQGFLQLLPIYLDHILYPTLRPSSFVTEVHHINPLGEDSGVVYSEMQGRQNSSSDLMSLKLQRLMNPPGNAYRSETAGLMEALRILTIEQITEYHKTYYVPHNLIVIVAGKISTPAILETLQSQVEPSIAQHNQQLGIKPSEWQRPFVETETAVRPPVNNALDETVEFPEQDESTGELVIALNGPSTHDFLTIDAIDILGTYLTSSTTAPLNKEFVEVASPFCTYLYVDTESRVPFCDLSIFAGGVPIEYLPTLDQKLRLSLKRIASEGIDIERMSMVLKRERRKFYSVLESSKGDAFSSNAIEDFLYGDVEGNTLVDSLDSIRRYDILDRWTNHEWISLLQKYFIDSSWVVVRGKPSATLADKLAAEEKGRLITQQKSLGPHGIANWTKILAEAKAEHDVPIPADIITSFQVPSIDTISWIPVQSYRDGVDPTSKKDNATLRAFIEKDGNGLPFFVQFDHVESDFVCIHALISLNQIPSTLLPYVSLYLNAFFSLPVRRSSGVMLTHEEVVDQLDRDTVSYDASLGLGDAFSEMARITIKVEKANYEESILWLRDLLFGGRFDSKRLAVIVAKMLQSLPELKRDGATVLESTAIDLLRGEASILRANSLWKSLEFLPKIAEELEVNPNKTISCLEELRGHMTDPFRARFSATGNVLGVDKPRSAWTTAFNFRTDHLAPVPFARECLSEIGRVPSKKAIVVEMSSIESSFAIHTAKGVSGFNHPDWPALRVALELLNALESYLWRYIRGSGLAYGASVGADLEAGQVSFSIYRSPNSFKAFEEGAKVLRGLTDGSIPLESTLIDAAKSSIVYSVTQTVASPGRASLSSFVNQALKEVPQDHHRIVLEKCQVATAVDILSAMKTYLLPIFDPSSSVAVVVSAPGKSQEICTSLSGIGFEVETRTLDVNDGSEGSMESGSTSDSE